MEARRYQLHRQKLHDIMQTELIEESPLITSREEAQAWMQSINAKYQPPGFDDDWQWMLCDDQYPLFVVRNPITNVGVGI